MSPDGRCSVGVSGLDEVLHGGLLPERSYMVRGRPGTGKSVLGFHFLATGVAAGESALYVNFEEPTGRVRENAARLGIDLSAVSFLDLAPTADVFAEDRTYEVFAADEVESADVTARIVDAVDEAEPDRVFIDPLSRLRDLVRDDYQFRKEAASFMRYLTDAGATVLFSTQPGTGASDDDLQFLCDGAVTLAHATKGRTVSVRKFRGSGFQSGEHTLRIRDDGLAVYPELVPGDHDRAFDAESVGSGVEALDDLLGGGIERGTVTVVSGPSGVGKTTTATHFAKEAAARGERSAVFLFEEDATTFRHRSEAIGLPVAEMETAGTLAVEEVEPVSLSPDEFAAAVREEVERRDAEVVLIDGVSGYRLSIRGDEDDLVRELHALCRYLRNVGVTVLLTDDVGSITGDLEVTSARISYLADNVLFMRYLEMSGELNKAVGVLKKRAGDFQRSLREFRITEDGIELGDPLTRLRGILSGAPESVDDGR